jgi:hypothetical protein
MLTTQAKAIKKGTQRKAKSTVRKKQGIIDKKCKKSIDENFEDTYYKLGLTLVEPFISSGERNFINAVTMVKAGISRERLPSYSDGIFENKIVKTFTMAARLRKMIDSYEELLGSSDTAIRIDAIKIFTTLMSTKENYNAKRDLIIEKMKKQLVDGINYVAEFRKTMVILDTLLDQQINRLNVFLDKVSALIERLTREKEEKIIRNRIARETTEKERLAKQEAEEMAIRESAEKQAGEQAIQIQRLMVKKREREAIIRQREEIRRAREEEEYMRFQVAQERKLAGYRQQIEEARDFKRQEEIKRRKAEEIEKRRASDRDSSREISEQALSQEELQTRWCTCIASLSAGNRKILSSLLLDRKPSIDIEQIENLFGSKTGQIPAEISYPGNGTSHRRLKLNISSSYGFFDSLTTTGGFAVSHGGAHTSSLHICSIKMIRDILYRASLTPSFYELVLRNGSSSQQLSNSVIPAVVIRSEDANGQINSTSAVSAGIYNSVSSIRIMTTSLPLATAIREAETDTPEYITEHRDDNDAARRKFDERYGIKILSIN